MPINSISEAALRQYQLQAIIQQTLPSVPSRSFGIDSATFSPKALELARKDEATAGISVAPPIGDKQAQKIGEVLKRKNPSVFQRADSDNNNRLSPAEIARTLESAKKRLVVGENTGKNDGIIAKIGENLQKKEPALFEKLDENKDKKLGEDELKAGAKKIAEYYKAKREETGTEPPTGQLA